MISPGANNWVVIGFLTVRNGHVITPFWGCKQKYPNPERKMASLLNALVNDPGAGVESTNNVPVTPNPPTVTSPNVPTALELPSVEADSMATNTNEVPPRIPEPQAPAGAPSPDKRDLQDDPYRGGDRGDGASNGGGGGGRGGIEACSVEELCSGHAMKCMQKGAQHKCKCEPEWTGKDCSVPANGGGDFSGGPSGFDPPPGLENSGVAKKHVLGPSPSTVGGGAEYGLDNGGGGVADTSSGGTMPRSTDDGGGTGQGGRNGDDDDGGGGLMAGPWSQLSPEVQQKALMAGGGLLALVVLACLVWVAKKVRSCRKSAPPAGGSSNSNNIGGGGKAESKAEQWEDWDEDEEGGDAEAGQAQPLIDGRKSTSSASNSGAAPHPSAAPSAAPAPLKSSSASSLGGLRGLGGGRKGGSSGGAAKPKAEPKAKSSPMPDYPPINQVYAFLF